MYMPKHIVVRASDSCVRKTVIVQAKYKAVTLSGHVPYNKQRKFMYRANVSQQPLG